MRSYVRVLVVDVGGARHTQCRGIGVEIGSAGTALVRRAKSGGLRRDERPWRALRTRRCTGVIFIGRAFWTSHTRACGGGNNVSTIVQLIETFCSEPIVLNRLLYCYT